MRIKSTLFLLLFLVFVSVVAMYALNTNIIRGLSIEKKTVYSIEDRVDLFRWDVKKRLAPYFTRAGINYPPQKLALLAFKREQQVELWSKSDITHTSGATTDKWVKIKSYSFKAFSGLLGPKLEEGDKQIPEGIYDVIGLNPNSSYHLSFKINYPNEFDLKYAEKEGREKPGTNIFFHGRNKSVGCIALGDPAIEELFVLVALVGKENVNVIVSPYDFRTKKIQLVKKSTAPVSPKWLPELYKNIEQALAPFSSQATVF